LAAAVFLVSFGVGHWYGKSNSPDYNSKAEAVEYLISHVKVENRKSGNYLLVVDASSYRYVYEPLTGRITRILKPAAARRVLPPPAPRAQLDELDRFSDFVALSAIPAGAALLGALADSAETRLSAGVARYGLYAAVGISFITGGAFGYNTAYKDSGDYENPVFQGVLMNRRPWEMMNDRVLTCKLVKTASEIRQLKKTSDEQDAAIHKREEDHCARFYRWLSRSILSDLDDLDPTPEEALEKSVE